jgi:hypothetical protein
VGLTDHKVSNLRLLHLQATADSPDELQTDHYLDGYRIEIIEQS